MATGGNGGASRRRGGANLGGGEGNPGWAGMNPGGGDAIPGDGGASSAGDVGDSERRRRWHARSRWIRGVWG
jgi:hypothetical protein